MIKKLILILLLATIPAIAFILMEPADIGHISGIEYRTLEDRKFLKSRIKYFKKYDQKCYDFLDTMRQMRMEVGVKQHHDLNYAILLSYRDGGMPFMERGILERPLHEIIISLLKKGDKYIEVGASHGTIALHAANVVGKEGQVHAYEPTGNIGNVTMPFSACLNDQPQFTSKDFAIGNYNGTAQFNQHRNNNIHMNNVIPDTESRALSRRENIAEVQMRTLDSLHKAPDIDFLRLDVQGSECNVLEGAKNILQSPNLIVSFEWEPIFLKQLTKDFDPKKCLRYLQDAGFKNFWEIKGAFKTTRPLKEAGIYIQKVDASQIIKMKNGDREFIAYRKNSLPIQNLEIKISD